MTLLQLKFKLNDSSEYRFAIVGLRFNYNITKLIKEI